MTAIRFDDVTLARSGRAVFDRVSFEIPRGDAIALLGANGSGKSTLLQAVLGRLVPTGGRITVFDRPAIGGRREIGYLPQSSVGATALRFTGRALMAASLAGHRWGIGRSAARDGDAIEAALDLVDAAHLADRPLGWLSGGERQRLLIAQALLGNPAVLLLDEPLAGLDPAHQQGLTRTVCAAARAHGTTLLFSLHNLAALTDDFDHRLEIAGGRIRRVVHDGAPDTQTLAALYGMPSSPARTWPARVA